MRRIRVDVREGKSKVIGGRKRTVSSFGLRAGYWPCLEAPFIELAFNKKRYDIWYGLSLEEGRNADT